MSTTQNFDGNRIQIPGAYSTIKSGQKNPPLDLDFGTVLIIDTGSGAGYGGGAGINGTLASNKDAIYSLGDIEEMQKFAKGGIWYLLAQPLFKPAGFGVPGVSRVLFARAATTVPAELTYSFTGDGDGSESVVNGGTFTLQVKDEGLIGNGALTNSELTYGYAGLMEAGVVDTAKFLLKFYRGTYTGLDSVNNLPYNDIAETEALPELLVTSPEFDDIADLISWMQEDYTFNLYFKLKSSAVTGDGTVDEYDLANNLTYKLASGGTESYTSANLQKVLDNIADVNISFIFADDWGDNAQSANNFTIVNHTNSTESKFKPEVYIASGDVISEFAQSLLDAAYYDVDNVTVVHGGPRVNNRNVGQGYKEFDANYKAACFLGREAGLEPQVPLTFKDIAIDGERHALNDKEVIQALNAGVLVSRLQSGSFDVVKGINTLQKNDFLVNDDGTTHSKQIKRIARQLNKEIIVNAYEQLLKDPNGVNRNTLSALDVQKWIEGYLTRKIATPNDDNLILNFQEVVVTREGDAYKVTYKFTPNSEISFLFFTGFIVNV